MVEEWKDVVGFESFYKVSNFGNVYSYRAKRNMKLCDNGTGYYFVEFSIKGKSKRRTRAGGFKWKYAETT